MTDTGRREWATDLERARLGRFLEGLANQGRRLATREAYVKDWRALARWYAEARGRSFDLARVAPLEAVDYLNFLVRTCRPATVARRVLFFRKYAAEAHRAHELAGDVFKTVQRLWVPKPQPAAPRGLTAEEAGAALRNVERGGAPRDQAIVFLLLLTGIRVGELAGLEVRDLELGEGSGALRVRAETAKGGRAREVPLPQEVRSRLREYLAVRGDGFPALFVGQRGRMTPSGIRDVVARHAGVPPHRLRHTFAYEYLRSNDNDLAGLADVLGHASLDTTRGYAPPRRTAVPTRGPGPAMSHLLERSGPHTPRPRLAGREVLVDPKDPAACRVKGVLFAARQRFLREVFGEADYQAVLARLSPAVRGYAETPAPASWYEFASLVEYDRAIHDRFQARCPQVLVLLGAASAEYGMGTVYRALDGRELVGFLDGLAHFHGQYQKYGRIVFTRTERGVQMACYDNPCYSPLYCASAIGFFWEELFRHGARNARVEEPKCHCRGDRVCLYELGWS